MPILPPRKRDWVPGTYQIGVFVRTPQGTVMTTSHAKPSSLTTKLCVLAFRDDLTVDQAIEVLKELET